ncbi:hypothetical protein IEQ34_000968 [Dendrobium chrysotoxum]|uniref:Uncharacterized protein n=1 Tax=Dendrobium chrysotoxum TaxID=161865 RepID=A0AAV7H5I0_DENCH|nr:hypothetical protein IEQ34_000968 [Dendrobium chrysotoxum]
MHGIGKLKSVQALDGFYGKNEIGYRIGELEHMNDFRRMPRSLTASNYVPRSEILTSPRTYSTTSNH